LLICTRRGCFVLFVSHMRAASRPHHASVIGTTIFILLG
jgi:hypothetical protein